MCVGIQRQEPIKMLSLMGRVNGNDNNSVGGEISLQGPTKILQIWHVYFFFFANSAEIKKKVFFRQFSLCL